MPRAFERYQQYVSAMFSFYMVQQSLDSLCKIVFQIEGKTLLHHVKTKRPTNIILVPFESACQELLNGINNVFLRRLLFIWCKKV